MTSYIVVIVAADTSPVIALSSIWRLDLLRHVSPVAWLVPAVVSELITNGRNWKAAKQAQQEFAAAEWLLPWTGSLRCLTPPSKRLGRGEIEAISLAYQESGICFIDELRGRTFAKSLGVEILGSLGVLCRCKMDGVIPAVKPLILEIMDHGLHYSPELVRRVIRDMNE